MNPDTSRGNKSVDTMIEDGSLAGRHGCPFKRFPHWREKPLQPPYRSRGCHRAGPATYITPILHIVHNDTSVSIYIYIYRKEGGPRRLSRVREACIAPLPCLHCAYVGNGITIRRRAPYSLDQLSTGTLVAPPVGKL